MKYSIKPYAITVLAVVFVSGISVVQLFSPTTPPSTDRKQTSQSIVTKVKQSNLQPVDKLPIIPISHQQYAEAAGVADSDFVYMDYIFSHESGWCVRKWQGEIGYCPTSYTDYGSTTDVTEGYGLCQSTPAIKMESAGSDWRTNEITQIKWCNAYAMSRYGSWTAAYEHWINNHNW